MGWRCVLWRCVQDVQPDFGASWRPRVPPIQSNRRTNHLSVAAIEPAPDIASNSIKVRSGQSVLSRRMSIMLEDPVQLLKKQNESLHELMQYLKLENLRSWHFNSRKEFDQTQKERFTNLLGHKWNKELDKFTFKKAKVICMLACYSSSAVRSYRGHFTCHHKVPNRLTTFRLWMG